MAKIDITRTELVWPGKYNEDGTRREVERVNLPFQIIETINESQATREAKGRQPTLSDVWQGKEGETFEEGWRSKLIWGDNLLVMSPLLEKFPGKIDLIYTVMVKVIGIFGNDTSQAFEAEAKQL